MVYGILSVPHNIVMDLNNSMHFSSKKQCENQELKFFDLKDSHLCRMS